MVARLKNAGLRVTGPARVGTRQSIHDLPHREELLADYDYGERAGLHFAAALAGGRRFKLGAG